MTVRVLIIRPSSTELEAIELAADSGGSTHLAALRSALDASLVDIIRLEGARGIDAWFDDEFLYTQSEPNPTATNVLRAFGVDFGSGSVNGAVVFTGHDGRGGMVSLTDDQVRVLHDALRQAVYGLYVTRSHALKGRYGQCHRGDLWRSSHLSPLGKPKLSSVSSTGAAMAESTTRSCRKSR